MSRELILLLGGARSGKSRYAEQLASQFERVLYVATAQARDGEMAARIAAHRQARPSTWRTVEAPRVQFRK
jgi:adenosylcobinamide kinase/adenosylcobinamide-phosphate guanylyltransferase